MTAGGGPAGPCLRRDCRPSYSAIRSSAVSRAEAIGWKILVGDASAFDFSTPVFGALLQYPATDGRLADPDLRRRIIDHLLETQAFQQTVRRAADESKSNQGPSAVTSIMKYAGAKIAQERNELIVESLGTAGLGWEGEGYSAPELAAVRTWLRAKANSIEGGTSEINLNVVSKRVLGLPDPK